MITVTFQTEQEVQRLMYLLHRDLARVVGEQVMAEEYLDQDQTAGRKRKRALEVLASAPQQEAVLRNAQSALQTALKEIQK